MNRYELYTGDKTYMYPNGHIAPPERMARDYPAVAVFPHAILTDAQGQVCYAVDNWSALRDRYEIDPAMDDNEALDHIARRMREAREEIPLGEGERIAAALEFLALSALPDEKEETGHEL